MRNSGKLDQAVDFKNTETLKGIIKEQGWPDSRMVGKQAALAAWLLAQHADHDLKFQIRCLHLMERVPIRHRDRAHIAYLIDRILIHQRKPQKYGTQFRLFRGKLKPKPLMSPETVNIRRRRMGLSSLESYRKKLQKRVDREK